MKVVCNWNQDEAPALTVLDAREAPHPAPLAGKRLQGPSGRQELLLVGQANVGKSVLFGRLTSSYALVSNYPGTTVEIFAGTAKAGGETWEVVDTPGIDTLDADSEDERVTVDLLRERTDALLLQVGDAKNLRRTLLLNSELVGLGRPMALVLNMADEARQAGIEVDCEYLEQQLGIPVVTLTAVTGEGMDGVRRALRQARAPRDPYRATDTLSVCGVG